MKTESDNIEKEELNQNNVMRWFSVQEKTPLINQNVIIFDGQSVKDFYYFNNLKFFIDFSSQEKNKNVTHWMPLPSPPISLL
jgi:hypothetical protein